MDDTYHDISVFDLDKDGFVTRENVTMIIEALEVDGEVVEIKSVVTAETAPGFSYKYKDYNCGSKVRRDSIVLLSDKFYIAPCYKCEQWVSWPRKTPSFKLRKGILEVRE